MHDVEIVPVHDPKHRVWICGHAKIRILAGTPAAAVVVIGDHMITPVILLVTATINSNMPLEHS